MRKLFAPPLFALAIVLSACATPPTPQVIYVEQQQQVTVVQAPACDTCGQQPAEAPAAQAVQPSPIPTTVATAVPLQGDLNFRKYRLDAQWIGDDFSDEFHTPGLVVGPAIVEIKAFNGGTCKLVRVNDGETLNVSGPGSYWFAGSQLALSERWQGHVSEYTAKAGNSGCQIFQSANDVK